MPSSLELWNSLDELLQVHLSAHVDSSGITKLNRLARKRFPEICQANIKFDPVTSDIELTHKLSLPDLGEYKCAHSDKGARGNESPLVIILMNSVNYIVDGNHRVNDWLDSQIFIEFSAIKISPRNESTRRVSDA